MTNRWHTPVLALTAQLAANEPTALLAPSAVAAYLHVRAPTSATPSEGWHDPWGVKAVWQLWSSEQLGFSSPYYRWKAESKMLRIFYLRVLLTSFWPVRPFFNPRILLTPPDKSSHFIMQIYMAYVELHALHILHQKYHCLCLTGNPKQRQDMAGI